VFLAGFACGVEDFVGGAAGEPFIPEGEGQVGEGGQLLGEGLGLGGLGAGVAGDVEGIAGDDADAVEAPAESGEGTEVLAGVAFAGEGENGLGEEA